MQKRCKKILPILGGATICLLGFDAVWNFIASIQGGNTDNIMQVVRNVFISVLLCIALIKNEVK